MTNWKGFAAEAGPLVLGNRFSIAVITTMHEWEELEIIQDCLTVLEGRNSTQSLRTDTEMLPEQPASGGLRGNHLSPTSRLRTVGYRSSLPLTLCSL